MSILDEVLGEVEEGVRKLDQGEIWTANSHTISIAIVGIFLLVLALGGTILEIWLLFKRHVLKRLRN